LAFLNFIALHYIGLGLGDKGLDNIIDIRRNIATYSCEMITNNVVGLQILQLICSIVPEHFTSLKYNYDK